MSEENTLNFDELKNQATPLTDPEIPESVMNAPMHEGTSIDTDGLIISDDEFDSAVDAHDTADYEGPGMIIDTPQPKEDTSYKVGPMANKDRVEGVQNT